MTTTAASAPIRSARRTRTLTRAGRRSATVLGFAALTWVAFTGTAMALDGSGQSADQTSGQTASSTAPGADAPSIPLDGAVGSLAKNVSHGLTSTLSHGDANRASAVQPSQTSQTPPASIGSAVGQGLDHGVVGGVRKGATEVVDKTVDKVVTKTVARPATDVGTTVDKDLKATTAKVADHTRLPAAAIGSAVKHVTTYAVPHQTPPRSTETSGDEAAQATPQAGTKQLSVPAIVSGVEDAASDLTGNVLTATKLDAAVPAPHIKVLSNTLDTLGVSQALPTLPVPQLPIPTTSITSLPVVGQPVGDVLDTLPVGTTQGTGTVPGLPGLPGGQPSGDSPVIGIPTPATSSTVPVPLNPQSLSPEGVPTTVGAIPALPVLLPLEAFPDLGSATSPATFTSLTDTGDDADVHLSRSLLNTEDGDADDSSIPLPTGPHNPAGGHDGGAGSGQQQSGELAPFTLPGGGLVSPLREYRWHLPAAPVSDPGFSPD